MSRSTSTPISTAKRIAGTATLDVQATPGAKEIVLDSKGLEIAAVTDGDGRPLRLHARRKADRSKGAPLTVAARTARRRIRIAYRSARPTPRRCNG